jgi:proteasome lid subunit RPN8/RPN11
LQTQAKNQPFDEEKRYHYVEKAKKVVVGGIHTHAGQPDYHSDG